MKRRFEMAVRVREFAQAHPLTDPAEAGVIKQFEEDFVRAQAVLARHQNGLKAARGPATQLRSAKWYSRAHQPIGAGHAQVPL